MTYTKRTSWLVAAWVAATVATAGMALAVVGIADEQVGEHAVEPLSAQQVEALGVGTTVAASPDTTMMSSTTMLPSSTTVTTEGMSSLTTSTTGPVDVTATTEPSGAVTSTTSPTSTSTTTVTTTVTTTATTIPEETATIDSRQITGGTVVVRWTSSYVELVSASPADGFQVEVERRGPDMVEVEFDNGDITSTYVAEISDGQLVVRVEVETDDD